MVVKGNLKFYLVGVLARSNNQRRAVQKSNLQNTRAFSPPGAAMKNFNLEIVLPWESESEPPHLYGGRKSFDWRLDWQHNRIT